jgi:RNA polymerase sigma-70 factor (ECF subfamily)
MHPSLTEITSSIRSASDAECIAASLDQPDAFGMLYDRHAPVVFRYVRSRLGPDADDAVGDTFVIAFRTRARFNASRGSSALPWLLGIATNVIAKRRTDEQRWLRRGPADPTASDLTDDADARLDVQRLAPWLRGALEQLRRGDRDALVLSVIGELSTEDVASALGIPPGTVKSRLNRARRILAAQLEVHR